MSDEAPHHLESLTVTRLKSVAQRYDVDVSDCKQKKDFVARLASSGITEAQVAAVLDTEKNGGAGATDVSEIEHDIEEIAGKVGKGKVLPSKEDEEVERNIDRVLSSRPSFFEIDSEMQSVWSQMIMGRYHDALKANAAARSRMLDRFSSFQIFSGAMAIRAAESLLSDLAQAHGKVDPRLKTALAEAKRAFIDGNPTRRERALGELESLAAKAYEAFFEGSTSAEAELGRMLSDYESFGTQTQEPRRLLEIAAQARQSYNVAEYSKLLNEAKEAAARAKTVRTAAIEDSFGIVKSALHEAREVGAVLTVGEDELKAAKEAFDKQAFGKSVELLASIESVADKAHSERMRDIEVRRKQTARVSEGIAGLERALQEGATYGMDVQEGLLFVSKARKAFADRDLVTAAKLTRHLKDRSADFHAELDKQRVDRGVAKKVEGAKCGKCGKESLFTFPGDVSKCVKCGHSFSMKVEPKTSEMAPLEKPVSSSAGDGSGQATANADEPRKRRLLSR